MRRKLVIGNWKMHGSVDSINRLLRDITAEVSELSEEVEIAVCPTYIHIGLVQELLSDSSLKLGVQDIYSEPEGAFTGEVSAPMLAAYDVNFVIVGHSERREIFKETDSDVTAKFQAAQASELVPILCVGESQVQREQGDTEVVVLAQLDAVIQSAGMNAFSNAVIAYEPIWAIGTGQTATPTQAQEVHWLIRDHLAKRDAAVAKAVRIIYGGSVNSDNAKELFRQADIDGGLVGGASLKAEEFISICKSAD